MACCQRHHHRYAVAGATFIAAAVALNVAPVFITETN
jgi:hypothetical protein